MVILIVATDPSELRNLTACVERYNHRVMTAYSTKSALKTIQGEPVDLVLADLSEHRSQVVALLQEVQLLPQQPPVIVTSEQALLEDAVEMMKAGAQDFWIKPVAAERLLKTVEWLEARAAEARPTGTGKHSSIITQNRAMLQLKAIAKRVAASSATVFIQGESGTGKELFARYLHHYSERANRPFITQNCAALPENLMESELFGFEKGAFTGAMKAKEGKFELAHGGTLFLDEITEIPLHLQSKLLRVLQEGEVDRVGGKYPIQVDARVIASTNLIIEETVQSGQFRKDLYYRLNVIPLKIPPLRERSDDIVLLCRHFMAQYNELHKCAVERITPEALRVLQEHPWPGNVRELENVIQRAMLLSSERVITPDQLIFDQQLESCSAEVELMSIDDMEKMLIHKALHTFNGNRTRAAEILGISVRTLRNKLNLYADA